MIIPHFDPPWPNSERSPDVGQTFDEFGASQSIYTKIVCPS